MFKKKSKNDFLKKEEKALFVKRDNKTVGVEEIMNGKKDRKEIAAASGSINAFLGRGTEFEGKLVFDGVVRLDGKFKGEISSNDTLVIGKDAVVDAQIKVDTIIISGKITGNITAKSRIEVHAPGKLYGNVCTPVFVIEEGVIFEGSCTMESDRKEGQKAPLKPVEEVKKN